MKEIADELKREWGGLLGDDLYISPDNNIILLHGDCLNLMGILKEHSIDMVLSDIPYGNTHNRWDTIIPFEPMWENIHKLTVNTTPVVLFSQLPFGAELIHSNIKEYRYEWIWKKPMPTGFLDANRKPLRSHENIMVFYKKSPLYNPQKWQGKPYKTKNGIKQSTNYNAFNTGMHTDCLDGMRYPTDVIEFSNANNKEKVHPTQKPVDLLEYLIKTYTNENDVVLDFTMGSGSTGVACLNTNRNFIGIELDKDYYIKAKERIIEIK